MKYFKSLFSALAIVLSTGISAQVEFKDSIHLVSEVSNSLMSKGEYNEVVYKLYIPHGLGVSNWKEIEKPSYNGFDFEAQDVKSMKVAFETYKGVKYRMVILNKTKLKAIKKGKFKLEALKLKVTIDTPTNNLDQNGRPIITKEEKIFKSDPLAITVE